MIVCPIIFCLASGFVIVQSAFIHPVQSLILVFFLAGGIAATRLVKAVSEPHGSSRD